MSAAYELMQGPVSVASMSPTLIATVGVSAVAAAATFKRLTPHFHQTINDGEVGVWLRKGQPILDKGFTFEDVRLAEEENPFSKVRHFKIQDPDWRFVPPFRTLQTVDVADQPGVISLQIESTDDESERKKLAVHANITWHVSPDGDNPVRAITRVKHLKRDKKDFEAKDPERREDKVHPLEGRVLAVCTAGLGRVLSGRKAEQLYRLTYLGDTEAELQEFEAVRAKVQSDTIDQCKMELIKYGVLLTKTELLPLVRTPEEVQAQALRTMRPFSVEPAEVIDTDDTGFGTVSRFPNGSDMPGQRAVFS